MSAFRALAASGGVAAGAVFTTCCFIPFVGGLVGVVAGAATFIAVEAVGLTVGGLAVGTYEAGKAIGGACHSKKSETTFVEPTEKSTHKILHCFRKFHKKDKEEVNNQAKPSEWSNNPAFVNGNGTGAFFEANKENVNSTYAPSYSPSYTM